MSEFLKKKLPEQQGDIIDATGKKVGTHQWERDSTLSVRDISFFYHLRPMSPLLMS
jgi:hypothetical protein